MRGDKIEDDKITMKEYEAIAVMRDISLILYSEISGNLKKDCKYLSSIFEHLNGVFEIANAEMEKKD